MGMKIALSNPSITRKEFRYVRKALKSGWLTQFGSDVNRMEQSIREFYQPRFDSEIHATSTSNGTTALHLALLSLGVGPGDEVIIPGFCYVAVANSVLYCGAIPVIVDVDQKTWNLDIQKVASAVTPETKVVIAVDNYGREVDLKTLRNLLPDHVSIVQDSAESFPSSCSDDNSSFADLITVSLYANKIVTSGEGGAVIGRLELIQRINKLKSQSQDPTRKFSHDEIGYNYRITNLQSAIFNAQWERRNHLLKARKKIFATYRQKLDEKEIAFIMNVGVDDSPWLVTINLQIQPERMQRVVDSMRDSGIDTRPGFTAISKMHYISRLSKLSGTLSCSEALSESLISLPTYPGLSTKEISYVVDELSKALRIEI